MNKTLIALASMLAMTFSMKFAQAQEGTAAAPAPVVEEPKKEMKEESKKEEGKGKKKHKKGHKKSKKTDK